MVFMKIMSNRRIFLFLPILILQSVTGYGKIKAESIVKVIGNSEKGRGNEDFRLWQKSAELIHFYFLLSVHYGAPCKHIRLI